MVQTIAEGMKGDWTWSKKPGKVYRTDLLNVDLLVPMP